MDPVERPVEFLISENLAAPFLSAIALKILIRVRLARSCVSPVNVVDRTRNYLSLSAPTSIAGDKQILRFNN